MQEKQNTNHVTSCLENCAVSATRMQNKQNCAPTFAPTHFNGFHREKT